MINRGTGESERERAGNKCLAARKNVIAFLPYATIAEKDFAHWYAERIWKLMSLHKWIFWNFRILLFTVDSSWKNFAISDPEELELEPKLKASFSYNFFFYKLYYSKLSSIVKENRERKTDRENLHGNGVSSSRDDKNGSRIFRGPRSVPFLPLFPCNEMIEHAARIVIQARNKQRWLVTTYQRTIINCADMDYANYRERVYFRSIGATSMIIIIIGGSCAQRAWRIVKYNQRRGEG